jgi:hypothetical protein
MSTGSFALSLAKFAEKAKARADEVVGLTVTKIAAELNERSPVGDGTYWITKPPKGYVGGRFRANWQLGVDFIPTGVIEATDRSGDRTQGNIIASVPADAAGKVYFLCNNLPYARRIEDGWSRQAPVGVVGLTVIKFQNFVDEAVQKVKSGE